VSSDGCASSCPVGSQEDRRGRSAAPGRSVGSTWPFWRHRAPRIRSRPPHRRFAKASIAAAGSTPTTRQSGFLASAAASTPVPQPRSSILRGAASPNHCKSRNPRPAILNVVKSKDRRNGRTRSFRRSHAHRCWLAPTGGHTPPRYNGRQHWPKSGIAFPWRARREVGDL
jgi:hypothetical protein